MRSNVVDVPLIYVIELERHTYPLLLGLAVPVGFQTKSAEALLIDWSKNLPAVIYTDRTAASKKVTIKIELAVDNAPEDEVYDFQDGGLPGAVFADDNVEALVKDDFLSMCNVGYELEAQNVRDLKEVYSHVDAPKRRITLNVDRYEKPIASITVAVLRPNTDYIRLWSID